MLVTSAAMKAALAAQKIKAVCLGRFYLDSGTWGLADSDDSFTWNGQVYAGYGEAFAFDLPPATLARRPEPPQVRLSATDRALLASFFAEDYGNRRCVLSLLIFDTATDLPLDELVVADSELDAASIDYGAQDLKDPEKVSISTLTVSLGQLGAAMTRPGTRTRSDADQRLHRDPADGFFKHTGVGLRADIQWGNGSSVPVGSIGPYIPPNRHEPNVH